MITRWTFCAIFIATGSTAECQSSSMAAAQGVDEVSESAQGSFQAADGQCLFVPAPSTQKRHPDPSIPLRHFEPLVSESWVVTAASGTKMYHTWKWGPGKWSIERWTEGEGAGGQPWKELVVYYRDPQTGKIRFLGVSPFAEGIQRGTIEFAGDSAIANSTLIQTSGRREMQTRWLFHKDSSYTETLLEKDSSGKFAELVTFQHQRISRNNQPSETAAAQEEITEPFKGLKFLLGNAWNGTTDDQRRRFQTTIKWLPIANCVHATITETTGGAAVEFARVCIYHEPHAATLHCLIICANSEVYEGRVHELSVDTIQLELQERNQNKSHSIKSQFEQKPGGRWLQTIRSNGSAETDWRLHHER